jgi:hypothetical protein
MVRSLRINTSLGLWSYLRLGSDLELESDLNLKSRFRIMTRFMNTVDLNVGFFAEVNSLTEVWFILLNQSSLIGHIKYRTFSRETQLNHFLKEQTLVPLLNSTSGKQELKILSAFLNR